MSITHELFGRLGGDTGSGSIYTDQWGDFPDTAVWEEVGRIRVADAGDLIVARAKFSDPSVTWGSPLPAIRVRAVKSSEVHEQATTTRNSEIEIKESASTAGEWVLEFNPMREGRGSNRLDMALFLASKTYTKED